MNRPFRALAVVAAVSTLLIPASTLAQSPGTASPAPASPGTADHAPLEGTRWHLREYRAEDGGLAGAYDGGWLTLANGVVTGSSGCNDISGTYALEGDALAFGDITPTEASCLDGDIAVQEMALLARLPEVTTYAFEGPRLWLVDASGDGHLGFEAIVGPTWTPIYGGDEPMPEGYVTVRFTTTGVSGQGPCNTFAGPFLQDGPSVSIGPIESTRMACPALELENQLLNELQFARSYAIEAGDLVLLDEQGERIRAFTSDEGDD